MRIQRFFPSAVDFARLAFYFLRCHLRKNPTTTANTCWFISNTTSAELVHGLSPAQLEAARPPDRWSIRECVSRLAVAEPDYWRDLMRSVKAVRTCRARNRRGQMPTAPWYGIDRVVHTKTGGGHEKVDTYKDLGVAFLANF